MILNSGIKILLNKYLTIHFNFNFFIKDVINSQTTNIFPANLLLYWDGTLSGGNLVNSGISLFNYVPVGEVQIGIMKVPYTTCLACSLGQYADIQGSNTCKYCSAGTYANNVAMATCLNCTQGEYSSGIILFCLFFLMIVSVGYSTCFGCPIGSANSNSKSSTCKVCQDGSFSNQTSLSKCFDCNPGTAIGSFRGNIE